jgi:nucleotide-binding universal stress UspA family protein
LQRADTSGLSMPVRPFVTRGSAGEILVRLSDRADLVVVGSRGLGGFKGLVLGSVSHQVTHHASCPVVVVRPAHSATGAPGARRSARATAA